MRTTYSFKQKILSLCTLMVFFFAITPHEFIHNEITHHKDTIDHYHAHSSVTPKHIHCKFLQEVIAPYIAGSIDVLPNIHVSYYTYAEQTFSYLPAKTLFHFNLRGPPRNIQTS